MDTKFSQDIQTWFAENQRQLPWRQQSDPYRVWLSEVIMQQTRVEQGLPYYRRFLERFPTLADLAAAPEEEVLKLWEGLGYYNRARNMLTCARQIMDHHKGQFPADYDALLALKGIGPYTAAAIASIAFGIPKATVDGNVQRVLSRVFAKDFDIASSRGQKAFRQLADELVPEQAPGDFNQGLMELGALVCTPRQPVCDACPARLHCQARAEGTQHHFPVKSKKTAVKAIRLQYLVLYCRGQVLLRKRSDQGIWKNLYDFPGEETPQPALSAPDFGRLLSQWQLGEAEQLFGPLRHQLSHRKIEAWFAIVGLEPAQWEKAVQQEGLRAVPVENLGDYPKPVLLRNFLTESGFLAKFT